MKLGHGNRLNALRRSGPGVTPTPTAPSVVSNPSLVGTPQVGVPLTFNTGSASGFPAPSAVRTVRNAADSTLIATLGAGDTTWTPGAGEAGLSVFPRVVWTNSEGSATGNGANVGPIAAAGAGPVNLTAPSIIGVPEVGQEVEWDVGTWDGATTFDIEVVITGGPRNGEVVLSRRSVIGSDTGTITADLVDQSIVLNVWGINGDGETLATSPAFGPIIAAGIVWVVGLAVNSDQTLPSSPYPWTNMPIDTNSNAYAVPPGYGFVGTNNGAFSTRTSSDSRLRGRVGFSLTYPQSRLRINVPTSGTYRIWMGFGHSAAATNPNYELYDGDRDAGGILRRAQANTATGANQVMHADGTVTSIAGWQAVDPTGVSAGNPIDISVTQGFITLARNASGGAPQLNCIAVARVP